MIAIFVLTVATMLGIALTAVLRPLLARGDGRRAHYASAAVLTIALPMLGASVYWSIGDPGALAGVPLQPAASAMPSSGLQKTLPTLLQQGWDAQQAQRHADAEQAYAQALQLAPDNIDALLGWVEADMAQRPDFAIVTIARDRLERVLALQPDNQRALWMLGIAAFQQQHYAQAAAYWRQLQRLLPQATPLRAAVAQKIAIAQKRAGTTAPAPRSLNP
ncbi:cytochrome C biogenesis protein [Xanthomonas sp. MUS 060]|uniref:tetratricopeptide repeat protein n=1 Tax=Xanthomonas sp. MUS 060 TaxID=1588031 RepID=UPI000ABCA9A6|nr:cytochrome C biogenesis protein [Xanthomonas sp. MUS 060]